MFYYRYFLVEFAEKYLNIFSFILLFHLSTTQDISSFSVEYKEQEFMYKMALLNLETYY